MHVKLHLSWPYVSIMILEYYKLKQEVKKYTFESIERIFKITIIGTAYIYLFTD